MIGEAERRILDTTITLLDSTFVPQGRPLDRLRDGDVTSFALRKRELDFLQD